jgi:cobalamin biosynthesis protein CobW
MNQLLPVTLVTGFLGAGKTTIVANLIKDLPARRFAVVVNEFGEVSIDDVLIQNAGDKGRLEIHKITKALIAYEKEEQFIPAMLSIWQRRRLIDHVIIETSGLALPTAVLEALQAPNLADKFVLDATLAVVDTPWLTSKKSAEKAEQLFGQQLEAADVVILNKIENLDEAQLAEAETLVRSASPSIRFLELANDAKVDPRVALGLKLNQPAADLLLRNASLPKSDSPVNLSGHSHSGLGAHDHGIHTHEHIHEHDPGWLSFVLRADSESSPKELIGVLENLAKTMPLLRAKGFIHELGTGHHVLIQGVRDRFVSSAFESPEVAQPTAELVAAESAKHRDHGHEQNRRHVHHSSSSPSHQHGETTQKHTETHTHDNHGHSHSHSHDHDSHSHEHDSHSHEHDSHSHEHDSHSHEHEHSHSHSHSHDRDAHGHHHDHGALSELVFIGYHLNREEVVKYLNENTKMTWY